MQVGIDSFAAAYDDASLALSGSERLRNLDGTRVTMYAQWRTIEDYEAMRRNPAPAPFLLEALAIARFEPGMYEVVESYSPANEPA